jgi:hypothetical protein
VERKERAAEDELHVADLVRDVLAAAEQLEGRPRLALRELGLVGP